MIILGADLSWTRTGLVWIDENCKSLHEATVEIPPSTRRCCKALGAFQAAVKEGPTPTDYCLIEAPFESKAKGVNLMLMELQGIFKAVLDFNGIDYMAERDQVKWLTATSIKKFITGSGKAEKADVAAALKEHFGLEFANDKGHDLSDAAAVAVWGVEWRKRL